jgi:2-(1,2-epoxy-1,2-dihydrophenyl)acetyl-CoA isomerase
MAEPVLLEIEAGVARVRLNRPEASNALDAELLSALLAALNGCEGAGAVLLTGEGRNFCAGGDVKVFAAQGERLGDYLRDATDLLARCALALTRLPAVVVTAVQGYAAGGGGLGLVCASDLVIAAESARFMLGATRVAMAPDAGATVTLAQIIGFRRAMELALTNRDLDAHDALALGLVNRVVPDADLEAEALTLAGELAGGPTEALATTKRLLWDGLGSSVEERLGAEARAVSELGDSDAARKALRAVIERRR